MENVFDRKTFKINFELKIEDTKSISHASDYSGDITRQYDLLTSLWEHVGIKKLDNLNYMAFSLSQNNQHK